MTETKTYSSEELNIAKIILSDPDLRKQFMSLNLLRYMTPSLSKILSKANSIEYFTETEIDLNYLLENSEKMGLVRMEVFLLCDSLTNTEKDLNSFWSLIDSLKTKNIKANIIPILLNEYQTIINSSNEFEISPSLVRIEEGIKKIKGVHSVDRQDEDDLQKISDRLKLYRGEKESTQRRFFTGYEVMDSCVGGYATSELSIFMGASGIGKSTLLLNIGYQLWDYSDVNVHFYSLEMPIPQVCRRLDARILGVDSNVLRGGDFKEDKSEIVKKIEGKKNVFKIFDFPPHSTVQDIEESILKSSIMPDVVIVDYLGLMRAKMGKGSSLWEVLDEVASSLKYLSKRYHICLITASQVTGDAEKRSDITDDGYDLSDAKGAKSIGHHADIMCGVQYNENLNIMRFKSPKFRDGAKFEFEMFVRRDLCYLYDIEK